MKNNKIFFQIGALILLMVTFLTFPAAACAAAPGMNNEWLNFAGGGYLYIPASFTSDGVSGNSLNGGYSYSFYNEKQRMSIQTSELAVSANDAGIITDQYNYCLSVLPEAVYKDKGDFEFTLSGYSGSNIYYVQYTLDHKVLYSIQFYYPTSNRRICDPIVENVCNSFSTVGTLVPSEMISRPSSADLDLINADIKYPNYNWMYLDHYEYAVVSHNRAVYCFKDPDADVWREGNYFTVNRGTAVTILAESEGYACVILTGTRKAGWINLDYLRTTGIGNSYGVTGYDTPSVRPVPGIPASLQGSGRAVAVPENPLSAFGKAFRDSVNGTFYSDREKADIVTATYYDRKDAEGNRKSWYTSSYYDDPYSGYRFNFYYADSVLFFADAYIPGEHSSVTFYFWGDQMFACHDLRVGGSSLSFAGDADYSRILQELGNVYAMTSY